MPYIEYTDSETTFEGYLASDASTTARRPCILIAHAWDGLNAHWMSLADTYAQKGFVSFAIDVYGKGRRGPIDGDNSHLMNPLMADRRVLRSRLLAALSCAQQQACVLPDKLIIIGYCFGGLCALDLTRSAPPGLVGAVAVHTPFTPPNIGPQPRITASVLALHGWEDPFAPSSDVLSFASEMTAASADWQLHAYGHAKHGFTFVGADIPSFSIKYDANAHRRSTAAIDAFILEVLSRP